MEKQHDDILALIAGNLAGLADLSEESELKEWIGRSETNRKYFEQVRNIWNESDKQIDPNKINTQSALDKVLRKVLMPKKVNTLWSTWQRIAAVMILPLAFGTILLQYFNYNNKTTSDQIVYNEVYAVYGTRSAIKLADSTLVWLNSGSSLAYPNKFQTGKREVFLKGEAYFEVKSDLSHPFLVTTSDIQVEATGTKFNVFNYDSESISEVTLVSGKVKVTGYDKKNSKLISVMDPGQHLEYESNTGVKDIVFEDTYKYTAWKDGKLIFRNEPLDKVLKKIALLFNVDIELQGESLQNYRYRATFENESLDEILKLLKLSSPINYKEIRREPLSDGSFPKRKVIIFPAGHKVTY
jgi:transmembrane sensor